jgi:hypothetical protein
MLRTIVRRLRDDDRLPVKGRGFSGAGNLLNCGAAELRFLSRAGCVKLIVCYDADGRDPAARRDEVIRKIVKPSGVGDCCVVIPVQEIEAWILADLDCLTKIFKFKVWNPKPYDSPELVPKPSDELIRYCRELKPIPREYLKTAHNPRAAEHLDFVVVRRKCPSFRVLQDFVAAP